MKIMVRYCDVRVTLYPAPRGTGVSAPPIVQKLLHLGGIQDCYTSASSYRTLGPVAKATFLAIQRAYLFESKSGKIDVDNAFRIFWMTNRVRSLATRVTESLTTVQAISSSSVATGNDKEMIVEESSLKRIESFTSHIHHFTITSSTKDHSPDENVSSPESGSIDDAVLEESIALSSEAATNQYFTYDVKHSQLRITVLGPGGVTIPEVDRLKYLIPDGTVTVMCLTWNVASRLLVSLVFKYYHQETVKSLAEVVADTHLIFCWVRKWSQMVIVFIREPLVAYTSTPEWQFISCSPIVKPVRTKGAIAVFFRIFQASGFRIISDGPVLNRICDYSKICDSLRFSALPCSGVKQADCVFWLGDLNFRLRSRERIDALDSHANKKQENMADSFFDQLLIDDELTLERCKGLFLNRLFSQKSSLKLIVFERFKQYILFSGNIFEGFSEAYIKFPPTHKFILGTSNYVNDRIPSYTDRILYYAKESSRIRPAKYDCLWEENASDHKPVYGFFTMRVLEQRYSEVHEYDIEQKDKNLRRKVLPYLRKPGHLAVIEAMMINNRKL
uniref:IPPc domain-containing protein n=1 Tax=Wuchereria bancrofti TaxID=6293 RepID=A0A1I8ECD7_WUCBA